MKRANAALVFFLIVSFYSLCSSADSPVSPDTPWNTLFERNFASHETLQEHADSITLALAATSFISFYDSDFSHFTNINKFLTNNKFTLYPYSSEGRATFSLSIYANRGDKGEYTYTNLNDLGPRRIKYTSMHPPTQSPLNCLLDLWMFLNTNPARQDDFRQFTAEYYEIQRSLAPNQKVTCLIYYDHSGRFVGLFDSSLSRQVPADTRPALPGDSIPFHSISIYGTAKLIIPTVSLQEAIQVNTSIYKALATSTSSEEKLIAFIKKQYKKRASNPAH